MNDGNVYHEDVSGVSASYIVAIRTDNGSRDWVADSIEAALARHRNEFHNGERYSKGEFPLEAKIARMVVSNV